MIQKLHPGPRTGCVKIPASKSQAHRLLICAALGEEATSILCDGISQDIEATIRCLNALGAEIFVESDGAIRVRPISEVPRDVCDLYCGESGSTLRFLLPLVGALGARAVFHREGRLPERPLAPLDEELRAHGMQIRQEEKLLCCEGKLSSGAYSIRGDISSQFISGLLMALPLISGDSRLTVMGKLESAGYVRMTEDALRLSAIQVKKEENRYEIPGGQRTKLPPKLQVEGDYSNGAFFLCLGALSPQGMKVMGLSPESSQGDRAILTILKDFGAEMMESGDDILIRRGSLHGLEIDASPIPDLIPVLSVVAAAAEGETRIVKAGRLRLKESDRLQSTAQMLRNLGAELTEQEEGLVIQGGKALRGGRVDSCGDHRIAMSAAVAAGLCTEPVIVEGAECVQKSYPRFWQDYEKLTGGET